MGKFTLRAYNFIKTDILRSELSTKKFDEYEQNYLYKEIELDSEIFANKKLMNF